MQTIIRNRIQGTVSFFYVHDNGVWEFIRKNHNEVMFSGADLLAQAIVGNPNGFIRGMYMEYDTLVPTPPAVSRDRTPAYYEALTSPQGYARVPLTASPGYTPGGSDYQGNIVTVQAQTDGTYEAGTPFIDGAKIYSTALVAMPDPNDKSKDILFSAANTDAPIPKIANAQVGIKWDIKFL